MPVCAIFCGLLDMPTPSEEIDTQPPVVSECPDPPPVVVSPGVTMEAVTWFEPTATDDSGLATFLVERTHAPGYSFPVGITQVTYTFSDQAGNLASCIFTVIIGKPTY